MGRIQKSDYVDALIRGYFSLYFPLRQRGSAYSLKSEFAQHKKYLPEYMLYYWGWEKDYNLGGYDTGDPIEIGLKILAGYAMSWRYLKSGNTPRNVKVWKKKDFQHIFDIAEVILEDSIKDTGFQGAYTAAIFVALVDWTGYEFDTGKLREMIKQNIPKGTNDVMDVVVYGDGSKLQKVKENIDSWIPWPECVSR